MPSAVDKSIDGEDSLEPLPLTSSQPISAVTMHVYSFPSALLPAQQLRPKRRQVKNACTHCQKACKKCDDARPCLRCIKYGCSDECVDSQRKERKKGVKRGPYKKRDGRGRNINLNDLPPEIIGASHTSIPPGMSPNTGSYVQIPGFPGIYTSYPPASSKPSNVPSMYSTPHYIMGPTIPTHTFLAQTSPHQPYATHGLYQLAGVPSQFHPQYPTVGLHDGADLNHQYPVYSASVYPKLSPQLIVDSNARLEEEGGTGKAVGSRHD
ncbi:putative transcriptional regulatory protein C27B12.11c [Psilocybe cubensis]|uniref:Zn(2)-C6 fungal-type domain-containing protein n=2 Tax=Psilocybe cubensis TaxID=181762 RepID=A0A8H7Y504_PSICU|nr:putative transcriptional regulatory protein C27B12.11c [Psilocybe cubensis]KAH9483847.1 putative transcriptional regulatory protein C27B12.11c [Psilocybe cubensis]